MTSFKRKLIIRQYFEILEKLGLVVGIVGRILGILTVLIENLNTLTRVPRNRERLIALLFPPITRKVTQRIVESKSNDRNARLKALKA